MQNLASENEGGETSALTCLNVARLNRRGVYKDLHDQTSLPRHLKMHQLFSKHLS